ncbi:DEAD/DEAH box helicase [Sphingobacterium sp. lm-10]|uniref:DEAD/DEAH box helicase n=1 Tax=Sphingobacterium sp. lm-10 TaxID=2944904 RepID=UPI002020DB8B|nr:DEAD/DEAH box helicase [Sphingobacterium sp. lm-10]MCL7986566.1 DEAD/DEAH box helicase [Sphingobacterium sp. lm-10]
MKLSTNIQPISCASKTPYYYQQQDIDLLFGKLANNKQAKGKILYQLPTGGGKTLIFSEIAKRFMEKYKRKVIVLTHRAELCKQTTRVLKDSGVVNKVINSAVKRVSKRELIHCYVAMVETLKNRIDDGMIDTSDIGLVIVDEAHHNSFRKLLNRFENAAVVGVTATPFSADVNLPMNQFYEELVVGAPIATLINQGFLAKPKYQGYDVELNTLKTGINGDFTISTSDMLYGSDVMLDLLLHAYKTHANGKKTLIFNNGIFASRRVLDVFSTAGYPVRHLDNKTPAAERAEILKWYRKTKGAILTSVSILTTGFDEPKTQAIILYRATTSITLYHQMVGRGARYLHNKKTFQVIDLGNNTDRFGNWDAEIDWHHVFEHPEIYHENLKQSTQTIRQIDPEMRTRFPNSLETTFDVLAAYQRTSETGEKSKNVIRDSIRQHATMCLENSESITEALVLTNYLDKEIDYRIREYAKCLGNVTKNYRNWLQEDYKNRLQNMIRRLMSRMAG